MADIPEAYAIGHVLFLGSTIYLDSHPLIPRTETEWWVEKAIATMKDAPRVLDLCAGSGCIAAAVHRHVPHATVVCAELEARHEATIRKNVGPDVAIYIGDLYEPVPHDLKFDYILTNPPYLASSRVGRIEGSVLEHEPHEALFAEDDGFAIIQRIIDGSYARLNSGGQLWIEHEPEHSKRLSNLGLTTHLDQYGMERYSILTV